MERKLSTITILIILAAFGFLYVIAKTGAVSDHQYELEQKIDYLESRIEDIHR